MNKKIVFFFLLASFFILNGAYAGDTLYVQSVRAKLMSSPRFSSKLESFVKRGDSLTVLERGDGWYRVKTGTVEGWINRLCVSTAKPMKRVSLIRANGTSLEQKSRRRASAITSAAAARGLAETDRKRLNEKDVPDYDSLDRLQAVTRQITEKDIEDFQAGGGTQ